MANDVHGAAQAIADALAPPANVPSARWRWGTVVSVSSSGTMSVSVGGATVPGIRCAEHVMGAHAGDRVRVLYCGTEAIVDAVRATTGAVVRGSVTFDSTKATPNGDAFDAWRCGRSCTISVVDLALVSSLASGSNLVVGTVPSGWRPPKYCYAHSVTAGIWVRVTTAGELRISNRTGAALAAGAKVTFTLSYTIA